MDRQVIEKVAIVALIQSIAADIELAAGLAADTLEASDAGELERAMGGLLSVRPLAASMLAQIDAALALNVRRVTLTSDAALVAHCAGRDAGKRP